MNGSQITTLASGLRVITTPVPTAQSAAVALFVGAGSRGEDARTNGLSHYIEHMLFKGTERRPSAQDISQAIEGAGGSLNAYTSKELTCYWNNLPFERAETGIEVLADMIQHSALEVEEIDRERTVVQQEIRRAHDSPGQWVGELSGHVTYGDQPVGWPVAGTIETIEELRRDDFVAHIEGRYTASNCVLSVAGAVTHEQVLEIAEREFDALPQGDAPEPPAAEWGRPVEHIKIDERDLEQTNLSLTLQSMRRRDPDRYALDILATVLGRGMSSRLFMEVRERRGLAYSVSAGAGYFSDIGSFGVSAGVTREHQEEALEVILNELHRLVDEPVPEEELQRTKDFSTGTFRLSLERPMALGQRFGNQLLQEGEIETPDETVRRLNAVTAEDVQRVAKQLFEPAQFSLAVVGPSASADRLDEILTG